MGIPYKHWIADIFGDRILKGLRARVVFLVEDIFFKFVFYSPPFIRKRGCSLFFVTVGN